MSTSPTLPTVDGTVAPPTQGVNNAPVETQAPGPGAPQSAAQRVEAAEQTREARERSKSLSDLFKRLLRPSRLDTEPDPASEEPPGEGPSGAAGGGRQRQERSQAAGTQDPRGTPDETVTLTRKELEERLNAEANRREALRLAKEERTRRKLVRDSDPIQFAEEERQREATEEAQQANLAQLQQYFNAYDQHTLLPLLNRLPADVRQALAEELGGGVEGLEGRQRLVDGGLDKWEAAIRADERAKAARGLRSTIRENPAARKQALLAEADEAPAPDPEVGGFGASGGRDLDMNAQLRALLRGRATKSR